MEWRRKEYTALLQRATNDGIRKDYKILEEGKERTVENRRAVYHIQTRNFDAIVTYWKHLADRQTDVVRAMRGSRGQTANFGSLNKNFTVLWFYGNKINEHNGIPPRRGGFIFAGTAFVFLSATSIVTCCLSVFVLLWNTKITQIWLNWFSSSKCPCWIIRLLEI